MEVSVLIDNKKRRGPEEDSPRILRRRQGRREENAFVCPSSSLR